MRERGLFFVKNFREHNQIFSPSFANTSSVKQHKKKKGGKGMKSRILVMAILAAMLSGCSSSDTLSDKDASVQEQEDLTERTTLDEEAIEPVQGDELSTEKHGYGQGVQVDEQNRPIGALDFNAQYSQYNATAIDEDEGKILLTFDQGYENGLTEGILDTLKEKKF